MVASLINQSLFPQLSLQQRVSRNTACGLSEFAISILRSYRVTGSTLSGSSCTVVAISLHVFDVDSLALLAPDRDAESKADSRFWLCAIIGQNVYTDTTKPATPPTQATNQWLTTSKNMQLRKMNETTSLRISHDQSVFRSSPRSAQ